MRKSLLLFLGLFASLPAFSALNKYYSWANRFDDLNIGDTFTVMSASLETLSDATAVVVADPLNPSNKVLHVTTGSTPGFVVMNNPGDYSASSIMSSYSILKWNVMRPAGNEATSSCKFGLYFSNVSAYTAAEPTVLAADEWTNVVYSRLSLAKSTRSKTFMLGLNVANADYYIDDICFMSSLDAFDKEKEAIERARQDSLFQIELERRNAIMKEQDEAFRNMLPEINENMDVTLHHNFEDYPVGTTFPVYPFSGDTPVPGAKAVVELDGNNKVLHVTTPEEGGYVEFDNYNGYSASSIMSKFSDMCIQIKRAAGNTATESSKFEIEFGGIYAHNALPGVTLEAGKWVTNTFHMSMSKSSRSKKMRIGLVAAGADYYIDNIYYPQNSYDMTFSDKTKTARYWADQIGKNIGVCVNPGISLGDMFGKTSANNFNMVVCENAMKFEGTEPGRNRFNWQADGVVDFALQNGMKVRGHTLVWHAQNGDWVDNFQGSRKDWENILKNHIYNVVGHWKGKVSEWDVVNECLEENSGRQVGQGYSTRSYSVWRRGFGDESYIDSAFVWAHQADPDAKLYINDYNIGAWDGNPSWEVGKTHAMYNLAKRLKDDGIPIDGIGMQTHINLNNIDPAQIEKTIIEFRKIGLNVIITEMDLPGGQTSGSGNDAKLVREISQEELAIQAYKYGEIARIMAKYDNTPTMVVWGLVDNRSWLDCSEGTKPLLFFADYTPHPAYIEVRKAYQRQAMVMAQVEDVFADDSEGREITWFETEDKKVDVYNLIGQKIATGIDADQVYELPNGLYIIEGRKVLIRE